MTATPATPDNVLEFWLGPEAHRDDPGDVVSARWWKKDSAFDGEIRTRFGETIRAAAARKLGHWTATPRGNVALVVVLDQFTRNVYRGSGQMYDHDGYALNLAETCIDAGLDQQLKCAERYFLYMPLMHAETLPAQDRCQRLFAQLAEQAPHYAGSVKYAKAHRDIVARFGRFPHRNSLLARPSTAEEEAFLLQPGSSF